MNILILLMSIFSLYIREVLVNYKLVKYKLHSYSLLLQKNFPHKRWKWNWEYSEKNIQSNVSLQTYNEYCSLLHGLLSVHVCIFHLRFIVTSETVIEICILCNILLYIAAYISSPYTTLNMWLYVFTWSFNMLHHVQDRCEIKTINAEFLYYTLDILVNLNDNRINKDLCKQTGKLTWLNISKTCLFIKITSLWSKDIVNSLSLLTLWNCGGQGNFTWKLLRTILRDIEHKLLKCKMQLPPTNFTHIYL